MEDGLLEGLILGPGAFGITASHSVSMGSGVPGLCGAGATGDPTAAIAAWAVVVARRIVTSRLSSVSSEMSASLVRLGFSPGFSTMEVLINMGLEPSFSVMSKSVVGPYRANST